jgi:glycosyltransferase involved in cell wall biosynthesis
MINMRVNSYIAHTDASSFYRMYLPATALAEQKYDVEIFDLTEEGAESRIADLCVFNRPYNKNYLDLIRSLLDNGYKVAVDIDDDFSHVPTAHSMYEKAKEIHAYVSQACEIASIVTVSTPALAEIYGFGHCAVIPNYIPKEYLEWKTPEHNSPLMVGWAGTISSHPNDLQVTNGAVARAIRESGADLGHVGPRFEVELVKNALHYKGSVKWSGWFRIEDYYKAISNFDIGLVPLEDNSFNMSKSWIKGLEYASVGVPFIASPTPEYLKLHELNAGCIAKHPNHWYQHLMRLITDEQYYNLESSVSKQAAAKLTIEENSNEWWEAWEKTL